jgi:hypothetical protein
MRDTMRSNAVACQGSSDSHDADAQGNELSLVLQMLREAIDESDWKHEALAVQLQLPNAAYLSRMLSGEKAWTLPRLVALPNEINKRFAEKWARSQGSVVVAPLSGPAAIEGFVGGLIGLLTASPLPAKAGGQLKVNLDVPRKAAAR